MKALSLLVYCELALPQNISQGTALCSGPDSKSTGTLFICGVIGFQIPLNHYTSIGSLKNDCGKVLFVCFSTKYQVAGMKYMADSLAA